jgi:hypothetical protein
MSIIEREVAREIRLQLALLMAKRPWPLRPPANTLRGVDFYAPRELVSALIVAGLQFKHSHGYLPNFERPETFSEHLFLRKFFSPLPMPSLADKLAAYD